MMMETIHLYGTSWNCGKEGGRFETERKIKIAVFYHGVSFLYITSFITRFCSPTSMTTQLYVALIFSGQNGLKIVHGGVILIILTVVY